MRIGIIGGGRVGKCLAGYFKRMGSLCAITGSTAEKSAALAAAFGVQPMDNAALVRAADVIFITVPDRKIADVAREIAALLNRQGIEGKCFFHCSGSLGLEPLAALTGLGAHTGSLHPLQSFAGGATILTGVYMAIDGDAAATACAQKLAAALGGICFKVPANERAAYHAAACFASNYAVVVETLATKLMSRWTGSEEAAWQALLPLFNGTANNLKAAKLPGAALTGPIARGDAATIEKHLAVLPDEYLNAYLSLSTEAAKIALTNGTIDSKTAGQLEEILQRPQKPEV